MVVQKSSHRKKSAIFTTGAQASKCVPRFTEPHICPYDIRAFRTTLPFLPLLPSAHVVSCTQRCLRACTVPDLWVNGFLKNLKQQFLCMCFRFVLNVTVSFKWWLMKHQFFMKTFYTDIMHKYIHTHSKRYSLFWICAENYTN